MYDELVKRLLSAESNNQETLDCLSEAADAIEELQKRVPKTPHGRLIDADALIEAMARMVPWAITDPTENAFLDGLSAAYEATNAAPTIIPAEPSKEENK